MIGYLDLPSGLSGDMFLSCLVDAGWSVEALREAVGRVRVPAEEYSIESQVVMRGPLRATHVKVTVGKTRHERRLGDVERAIGGAELSDAVKGRAMGVFRKLAAAEARVHGTSVDEVHFHEVGAVDAIIDIVGAAAGMEALGIEGLYASAVPLGSGWVTAAHGRLPVPAPATMELLGACGATIRPSPGEGELVTPTGAAILAAWATFEQPAMRLSRVATGAGTKDFAWPNVARLWVGEPTGGGGGIVQVDTNIDDMNPQLYGPVSEKLIEAGAVDVWLTPVQMKKGRPGVVLSVLCPAGREGAVADVLLRETTTLGVRVHAVSRHEAGRRWEAVATEWGEVRVKVKLIGDAVVGGTPEFEDCRRVAAGAGVGVQRVIDAARGVWEGGRGA